MPRGDKPTTVALALKDGWVYEDALPAAISKEQYDWWYKESLVLDGVRMGPPLHNTTPNPTNSQQSEKLDELCPWCAEPPDVHDKNNLGLRYLGCPTKGCIGRQIGFIIDHQWNRRAAVAGPRGDDDRTAMKVGDTVRFVRDGEQITATILEFAPRVFGGPGFNINTTEGWVPRDDVTDWTPAAASSATPAEIALQRLMEDRCGFCGGKTEHKPDCDHGVAAPADNDAESLLAIALESQEFYELMQSYRHASLTKQSEVVKHYEAVKEYIRSTTKGVR